MISIKSLLDRARQVKFEIKDLANTALRIGQLLIDMITSGVSEYDKDAGYVKDQYVIFNGVLAKATDTTGPGQSPVTHPAKWALMLVTDPSQATVSNNLPIAASVVRTLINQIQINGGVLNATTINRGVVRQATDAEALKGENNETYTTPKHLKAWFAKFYLDFGSIVFDPQTLQSITERGSVTNKDVRVRTLVVDFAPDDSQAPYPAMFTPDGNVLNLTKTTHRKQADILYPEILSKLNAEGRLNGGGTGGTLSLNESIMDYIYVWIARKEGRTIDPLPPIQGGGTTNPTTPTLTPKINSNNSKYEADKIGASIVGNCSNGEEFWGCIKGTNGIAAPDQGWHRLSRIAGDASNGTYALAYYDLPAGGFLQPGTYKFQIRIGVDDSSIVETAITVDSTEPVGTDIFKIEGKLAVWQAVQNELYRLFQKFSDGSWREFLGNKVWVIVDDLPGIGIAGGYLSGGPGIIQADRRIVIRCGIGINVDLSILLTVNQDSTEPTTPTIAVIIAVFGRDDDYQGRIALANATRACQVMRIFNKVVDGKEVKYSETGWFDGVKIEGEYNAGGATLQHVWGFDGKPTEAGTYRVYDVWREKDNADNTKYKVLSPYYTIVVNHPEPTPNTIEYLQYRFVTNFFGSGQSNDLLEIQMRDGFDEQPMFVQVRLASQSAPASISEGYSGFYRNLTQYNAGTPVSKSLNRSYQLASGQNLKNKSLRVYIIRSGNAPMLIANIVTGTTNTNGFVNIYSDNSSSNTEWDYDNDQTQ